VIHDVDVITKHIDMERHAIFDMVYGDYEQARTNVYLQPKEGRENYRIPHGELAWISLGERLIWLIVILPCEGIVTSLIVLNLFRE
jgi:hypothetical protein